MPTRVSVEYGLVHRRRIRWAALSNIVVKEKNIKRSYGYTDNALNNGV
jgi:hypothetical protein